MGRGDAVKVASRQSLSRLVSERLVEEEALDHPIPDVPATIGQRACFPAAHRRDLLLWRCDKHGFVPNDPFQLLGLGADDTQQLQIAHGPMSTSPGGPLQRDRKCRTVPEQRTGLTSRHAFAGRRRAQTVPTQKCAAITAATT